MKSHRSDVRGSSATFGAWVTSGHPLSCEIMGRAGYDWIILDTQHRGLSPETVLAAIQATDLGHTPTLVRVGSVNAIEIMRALDVGAAGVVVPVVNNAGEARAVIEAMRYPPHGSRSYGPVRDFDGGMIDSDPLSILMIETIEAMRNLDEIASVPGVDCLLIGPADLAISMGQRPGPELTPELWETIDRLVETCRRHDVVPGCATIGMDLAAELADRGVRFITVGADMGFVRAGAAEQGRHIAALHRMLADRPA